MKPLLYGFLFFVFLVGGDSVWAQRGRGGPVGPRIEPEDLDFELGVAEIPDRETFEKLSYQGPEVSRDAYLADLEFVKFCIDKFDPDNHKVYFMNTQNYRAHPPWMGMVGISTRERGAITFLPRLTNPAGGAGLYIVDFQPNDSYAFEDVKRIQDMLVAKMPLLKGRVAFHPMSGNMAKYEAEKEKYDSSDVAVYLDSDIYKDIAYLPLNSAESFGLLKVMDDNMRPSPRDVVICQTLPNQMPRVAGVISEVRQTPLSHVNLRAVQDKVPNAFIKNALQDQQISSLVGKLVRYEVSPQGYRIREATPAEFETHFASLRPAEPQVPVRDLSEKKVKPLSEIEFANAGSFGSKTANLATMHSFGFSEGTIPAGFGVPFYFYDEYMKHNGFYDSIDSLLADSAFLNDRKIQQKKLAELRKDIEGGEFPDWMMKEIGDLQNLFANGTSIRCRSSTNNEDLPGFSGAGLYDSFTHKPDEGHLSTTIKQVFASLWNFRAFEEREFYRIDHKTTAMGVLLHPNFKEEKVNGVAVTDDVLYETQGNYYLNTQLGEDMVTNPGVESSPEETLLGWWEKDGYEIVRRSTQVPEDQSLLNDEHLNELRKNLAKIHGKFAKLYSKNEDDKFAMEIEFKVTKEGRLVIKQARPWIY